MNDINLRIRQLRRSKNFTQDQLADYLGVTKQSISKYETDKVMPGLETLVAMAQTFEVSLDYLILGKDFRPPASAAHTDKYVTAIKEDLIELQKARINTLEKLIRRHCPEAAELAF